MIPEINLDQFSSLESLSVCNDFFGATWHSSYVRLIEVMSPHLDKAPDNLAFAIANQRSTRNTSIPLEICLVEPSTTDALNALLALALHELSEPDHDTNSALISVLQKLDVDRVESIYSVRFRPGITSRASHDVPLPRSAVFWRDGQTARYLAVHHES